MSRRFVAFPVVLIVLCLGASALFAISGCEDDEEDEPSGPVNSPDGDDDSEPFIPENDDDAAADDDTDGGGGGVHCCHALCIEECNLFGGTVETVASDAECEVEATNICASEGCALDEYAFFANCASCAIDGDCYPDWKKGFTDFRVEYQAAKGRTLYYKP
ncbi:hypothetical protein K8I61_16310 [bacterium]|nr:hypothetical protein [bacterium]